MGMYVFHFIENVYSLGTVLLELIIQEDPSQMTNFSNTGDETLN